MEIYNKDLKAHAITNTFYLIIIIPFLILALFSSMIMFNTKNAGGYANIFGYYVIEVENDNFFNQETGTLKKGTKQIFKATHYNNLKSGDIVVYYSTPSSKIKGVNHGTWEDLQTANMTLSANTSSATNEGSSVKIVKIGPKKNVVKDDYDNQYTLFSYYESFDGELIEDTNNLILGDDIIGVAVPTTQFVANAIDYAKTSESLFLLILLPCCLLVLINIMSIGFYKKFSNQKSVNSENADTENQVSYAQIVKENRSKEPISRPNPAIPKRPQRIEPTTNPIRIIKPTQNTSKSSQQKITNPNATPNSPKKPPKRPQRPQ